MHGRMRRIRTDGALLAKCTIQAPTVDDAEELDWVPRATDELYRQGQPFPVQ